MLSNRDLDQLIVIIADEIQTSEENLRDLMQSACPNDQPSYEQRREAERLEMLRDLGEKLQKSITWYVTRYRVTREFGGPEEGGWWYDWYEVDNLVPSIIVPRDEGIAHMVANDLTEGETNDKKERGERNRFSMAGSPDYIWRVETEVGEHEKDERPHYE